MSHVSPNNVDEQMGLRALALKDEYNTEDDDIIRDLYGPCFKLSTRYDRAVGYFRASIYRELGEELLDFAIRGGKVRLVCSPDIPESDEMAAREGYEKRGTRGDEYLEADLIKTLDVMSKYPNEVDCLNMLRLLIEKEALELFIAIRPGGIFHRKVGAFIDNYGNKVVFSGSGNETQNAITTIEVWSNDESFDVFKSWGGEFEVRKAESKDSYLKKLISGGTKRTKVRPINEVEKEYLQRFREYSDYESCRKGASGRSQKIVKKITEIASGKKPYYYQEKAIQSWEDAGRIGMLSMATGTGKTITSLFAIKSLVEKGRPILILVPSAVLMDQWLKAVREFYPTTPVLCAGGGYDWKAVSGKRMYIDNTNLPRIILATMDTAVTDDFVEFIKQASDPVLVVDEAHRLGSENHRKIFELNFPIRLGLSATPERLYDEAGSNALKRFFGDEPVYNLPMGARVRLSGSDAKDVSILGHFLSRYTYDFKIARLNKYEQEEWDEKTSEIRKIVARSQKTKSNDLLNSKSNYLKLLLIQRANIVKSAADKAKIANQVISEEYSQNGRWLVYCQDEKQLSIVFDSIRKSNPHVNVLQYHSKMSLAERERTLNYFEKNPGIIVSIKCLDEGVDVPAADGALILASSTNPREYIQRRGRVLRKSKDKRTAKIIDVLVLPDKPEQDKAVPISIIRGELARAYEFAKLADNCDVQHKLWEICIEYGVNIDNDYSIGFEES